jgi:heterodisulfide reductase subunit A
MNHIGVFLCTCDGEIDESIDVAAVEKVVRADAFVAQMPHACLPDGIRALKDAIRDNNLERVVVAACPARLQEKHLRDACVDAGVNVNHFSLVDWREGCAWAHRENATPKALDLVQMGSARVGNAQQIDGVLTRIAPHVLVIGGGIAGMTAARALADRSIGVTLVEQAAYLGGQLRGIPLNGTAKAYDETLDAVRHHPYVRLRLNARVVKVDGSVGDYHVKIEGPNVRETSNIGAIIIATGAQEYRDPRLYRYDGRRVVTLREFENPVSRLTFHDLVYVLCAGARDNHISYCSNVCCLNALSQAIRVKHAKPDARVTILFRDLYLLGDESNEGVVREARRTGVEFARYAPTNPPRVEDGTVVMRDELTGTTRRIEYDRVVLATPLVPRDDAGVIARLFNLPRDADGFFLDPHLRVRPEWQSERGIFVCGSAHRPVDVDTAIMQGLTTAARAARFVQQRKMMRPAWSARVNEQVCTGCAQCVETCAFGAIATRPSPFPLPERERGRGEGEFARAVIDPFLCLACGNCVVACPSKAITMPNPSDAQIFAQIDAALCRQVNRYTSTQEGDLPVHSSTCLPVYLIFACQWSGFAAMELAGARRMQYPTNVRVIELPCSARLDPLHVLYALVNGAERVLVALCPPDECHFGDGNRYAEARIENLRAQLAAHGIDPQRVQIARMTGDDASAWVRMMEGGPLVYHTTD